MSTTQSPEQLTQDLAARLIDRWTFQEPTRARAALEALALTQVDRLAVGSVLRIQGAQADPAGIARAALACVAGQLQHPVKENPPVAAIQAGDLVLLVIDAEHAQAGGKALENRLEKQVRAIEHAGGLGVLVLEQLDAWPSAPRQKLLGVIAKHQHPRLFAMTGEASPVVHPWLARGMCVEQGEASPRCRRALGR